MGELMRLEDSVAGVRAEMDRAANTARRSDMLLEDMRAQAEVELVAIGDEIKKLYQKKKKERKNRKEMKRKGKGACGEYREAQRPASRRYACAGGGRVSGNRR